MPVRLLVVSPSMARGGAQRFGATLLAKLNRSRFSPELALLRNEIQFDLPADVPVYPLGYRGALTGPLAIRNLARLLDRTRPDVILSTLSTSSIMTGWALKYCHHRPVWVARIGNNPRFQDSFVRRRFVRRYTKDADFFVANAEFLREPTEELYPFTRGRLQIVRNPANFSAIDAALPPTWEPPAPGSVPIILSVARLEPQKRPDLLLQVFARVLQEHPAELWIAGDGPLEKSVRQQAHSLGIAANVRFLGFSKNPFELMLKAQVFLLTSDHEGLPNALIEAQGLGLPAVSTRCGPEEVIVEGKTGLLTDVGDVSGLATAVLKLLKDTQLHASFSEAARRLTRERFDVEQVIPVWEAVLLAAAKGDSNTL